MIDVVIQVLLGGAIVAAVARVLRPGLLADRVIAFDTALLGLVGLFATAAVVEDREWLLDALPLIGLLAVVATVTFAFAVRRRG